MKHEQVDIPANAKGEIVDGLHQALAETSILTLKAQNYHWNVTGMSFGALHELFQKIYEDHFAAQDDLAERIRSLGHHADGRFSAFQERSAISEAGVSSVSPKEMVSALAEDQSTISKTFRRLAKMADEHGDIVTNDLAIERANAHDKFAWMLAAHLES